MVNANTGYKQNLYFGDESSYGTGATINQAIGLVQSVNPTETNNLIKVRTLGGTRDYNNIVPGKFEISGTFDYFLQGASFLRMAMGEDTATTTTTDSGPKFHTGASYLHVMGSAASPTANSFPSFELEFTDDEDGGNPGTNNLKRRYRGCRVNSLSISGSIDEPVSVSVDWMAQNVQISTAAASSVTESTDDPYVFYQGAVYSTTGTITAYDTIESGSKICEVNGFDWSVNNNVDSVWYICGTTASQETSRGAKLVIPKGRDYELSLDLHFSNKTLYERFLGAASATEPQDTITNFTTVLEFVRTGTIGSDPKLATDDWIRVVMPSTKFRDMNITGNPEDIISQSITVDVPSAKVYVVDADSIYTS